MITLTRADGGKLYLFPEHIVAIADPVGGEPHAHAEVFTVVAPFFVRETPTEVMKKVLSI